MEHEPIEGWMVPVYHALAAPTALLMAGVPQTFLILDVLGTLVLSLWSWRCIVLGLACYAVAWVGTQYEVQWWDMLQAYRRYHEYYEG